MNFFQLLAIISMIIPCLGMQNNSLTGIITTTEIGANSTSIFTTSALSHVIDSSSSATSIPTTGSSKKIQTRYVSRINRAAYLMKTQKVKEMLSFFDIRYLFQNLAVAAIDAMNAVAQAWADLYDAHCMRLADDLGIKFSGSLPPSNGHVSTTPIFLVTADSNAALPDIYIAVSNNSTDYNAQTGNVWASTSSFTESSTHVIEVLKPTENWIYCLVGTMVSLYIIWNHRTASIVNACVSQFLQTTVRCIKSANLTNRFQFINFQSKQKLLTDADLDTFLSDVSNHAFIGEVCGSFSGLIVNPAIDASCFDGFGIISTSSSTINAIQNNLVDEDTDHEDTDVSFHTCLEVLPTSHSDNLQDLETPVTTKKVDNDFPAPTPSPVLPDVNTDDSKCDESYYTCFSIFIDAEIPFEENSNDDLGISLLPENSRILPEVLNAMELPNDNDEHDEDEQEEGGSIMPEIEAEAELEASLPESFNIYERPVFILPSPIHLDSFDETERVRPVPDYQQGEQFTFDYNPSLDPSESILPVEPSCPLEFDEPMEYVEDIAERAETVKLAKLPIFIMPSPMHTPETSFCTEPEYIEVVPEYQRGDANIFAEFMDAPWEPAESAVPVECLESNEASETSYISSSAVDVFAEHILPDVIESPVSAVSDTESLDTKAHISSPVSLSTRASTPETVFTPIPKRTGRKVQFDYPDEQKFAPGVYSTGFPSCVKRLPRKSNKGILLPTPTVPINPPEHSLPLLSVFMAGVVEIDMYRFGICCDDYGLAPSPGQPPRVNDTLGNATYIQKNLPLVLQYSTLVSWCDSVFQNILGGLDVMESLETRYVEEFQWIVPSIKKSIENFDKKIFESVNMELDVTYQDLINECQKFSDLLGDRTKLRKTERIRYHTRISKVAKQVENLLTNWQEFKDGVIIDADKILGDYHNHVRIMRGRVQTNKVFLDAYLQAINASQ